MSVADTSGAVRDLERVTRVLAGVAWAEEPAAVRAEAVLGMTRAGSVLTVAQAMAVRAFDVNDDHESDGHQSTTAWLRHVARTEDGKAMLAWAKKTAAHPVLTAAVADGTLSASWAAKVMAVTAKIPAEARDAAEDIIADLAAAGGSLEDLRQAAALALARTATIDDDQDEDKFADRFVDAHTTMDGAGTLRGELTPECAAALQAVLGALDGRCGKEDDRTAGQRRHDALYQALVKILGTDLLPSHDGRAVTAMVHMTLGDLIAKADADGSPLAAEWITGQAARWAAALAGPCGGDGGAWVTGAAARGLACDAALFPLATAGPDPAHLDELVRLSVQLDGYLHARPATFTPDRDAHRKAIEDLTRAIIGTCAAFLSGPGGLPSILRTSLLGEVGLAGPSLILDAGDTDTIPWYIRKAVRARDRTCAWPGGCSQPAWAAQPHHLVHRADGGHSSTANLYSLCWFHHHIMLHRRGWTLRALGDGTLEAISPDGKIVYRSGDRGRPPPRAG